MRHTFGSCISFVYLGLKGYYISSEKKTKKNRQGQAELHSRRAKYQGLISQKWPLHLDFCAVSVQR